ncbi:hypothetical protein COV18_02515 [Candidatus Woesearchaeota archaeon CG10_big_fil_rev_8_21_14_0_10_37_12]|nr:MAG: hypothetical protein COV18_02515 [Candidatus Woesearchaeota archaeon CG10_big_fil_rev_8_21_14_0_10_37_12]
MKSKKTKSSAVKKEHIVVVVFLILIVAATVLLTTKSADNIVDIPEPILEETGVQYGDLITIKYILSLENGTVVDTTDEQLAQQHSVQTYPKGEYAFILGQSGKLKTFDEAIKGLSAEHGKKTIILEPIEHEIILDLDRTQHVERTVSYLRNQRFSITDFEKFFGKKPTIGAIVKSNELPFTYKVVNMSESKVLAYIINVKEGQTYTFPKMDWPSKILKIAEQDMLIYHTPKEGQVIETLFGNATVHLDTKMIFLYQYPEFGMIFEKAIELPGQTGAIPQKFQIIDVQKNTFRVKRYGSLADKRLTLEVELLEVVEDVKEVKIRNKLLGTERVN